MKLRTLSGVVMIGLVGCVPPPEPLGETQQSVLNNFTDCTQVGDNRLECYGDNGNGVELLAAIDIGGGNGDPYLDGSLVPIVSWTMWTKGSGNLGDETVFYMRETSQMGGLKSDTFITALSAETLTLPAVQNFAAANNMPVQQDWLYMSGQGSGNNGYNNGNNGQNSGLHCQSPTEQYQYNMAANAYDHNPISDRPGTMFSHWQPSASCKNAGSTAWSLVEDLNNKSGYTEQFVGCANRDAAHRECTSPLGTTNCGTAGPGGCKVCWQHLATHEHSNWINGGNNHASHAHCR